MKTLSRFLDFADNIIKKHSGFGYGYESASMIYLEETENPEPEGVREQKKYVTNLWQITNLKEENYLYRQSLTFLMQILQNRVDQNLYPTLEKQIEKAVREELPQAEERMVREFSREIRTLMREGGIRQMEGLKERLLPKEEEENSEPTGQTVLFRKLENIYNSSVYAPLQQYFYGARGDAPDIESRGHMQPFSQSMETRPLVFRNVTYPQPLVIRQEPGKGASVAPAPMEYLEEPSESAAEQRRQTRLLSEVLTEARKQTERLERQYFDRRFGSEPFGERMRPYPGMPPQGRSGRDGAGSDVPQQGDAARRIEEQAESTFRRAEEAPGRGERSASSGAVSVLPDAGMNLEYLEESREPAERTDESPGTESGRMEEGSRPSEAPGPGRASAEPERPQGEPERLRETLQRETAWEDRIRRSEEFARRIEEQAENAFRRTEEASGRGERSAPSKVVPVPDAGMDLEYLEENQGSAECTDGSPDTESGRKEAESRPSETPDPGRASAEPERPKGETERPREMPQGETAWEDRIRRGEEFVHWIEKQAESTFQRTEETSDREERSASPGAVTVLPNAGMDLEYLEESRGPVEGTDVSLISQQRARESQTSEVPGAELLSAAEETLQRDTLWEQRLQRNLDFVRQVEARTGNIAQKINEAAREESRRAEPPARVFAEREPLTYLDESGEREQSEEARTAKEAGTLSKAAVRTQDETAGRRGASWDDTMRRNLAFIREVEGRTEVSAQKAREAAELGRRPGAVFPEGRSVPERPQTVPAPLEYAPDEGERVRREMIETVLSSLRQSGPVPSADRAAGGAASSRGQSTEYRMTAAAEQGIREATERILRTVENSAGNKRPGNAAARSVAVQQIRRVLEDYAEAKADDRRIREELETILRVYHIRTRTEEMAGYAAVPAGNSGGSAGRFQRRNMSTAAQTEPAPMVYADEPDPQEAQRETRQLKKEVEEIATEIRTEKEKIVTRRETLIENQREIVREVITSQPSLLTEGRSGVQLARQIEQTLDTRLDESVGRIADRVYRRLEERLKMERERRGLR